MIKLLHPPLRVRVAVALFVIAGLSAPLGVTGPQALAMPATVAHASGPTANTRPAQAWPACSATTEYCWVDIHFDTVIHYCPNFTASSGNCPGLSSGTPAFTSAPRFPPGSARFIWRGRPNRVVELLVFRSPLLAAEIIGAVPGPGSANFSVKLAATFPAGAGPWYTPNLAGVPAGGVGGPLYIRFRNGHVGADVYIHGYLRRLSR
jgi:hypothetical protein